MFRSHALLILILLCSFSTRAQRPAYSRVKVFLDAGDHSLQKLAALGVPVDHGEYKNNTFFSSDFSAIEIDLIEHAGFKTKVEIRDVSRFYHERNQEHTPAKTTAAACNSHAVSIPSHFHLGSYGGHFTYSEMLAMLDTMHLLYPGIISSRQAIDTYTTAEGRPIYMVKISNHPTSYDSMRPQILYTAVHHAREPGSLTSLIFYMWYLLEHYSTDSHIRSIIDNTELYFIPCLNPDGYEYNIATAPSGGGLWRKNRRDNGGGVFGVDLNRNYGYFFGYDNIGSSPLSTSDVYRGTSGFSEPETQAVKWLCEHRHFLYNLNYHSFGNDIIYPWGYIGSLLTPDSTQFQDCGAYLTQGIPYRYGTGDQTVGYVTNGASDDWMYGEQTTKPKILAFTPEIGPMTNGFYPPVSEIIPDAMDNFVTSLHAADLLLPLATISTTDQKIRTGTSGYLHYDLKRLGYRDTTYTVTITSLDSRLTISSTPRSYGPLTLLQQVADSVAYTIAAGTLNGTALRYVRSLSNGFYALADTVTFYYGQYYNNVAPSTEVLTDWASIGWDTCTSSFHSAPAAIGSSRTGCTNYRDSTLATLQLTNEIDLTRARRAYLYFWTRWGIEANYDYAAVQVSPSGAGFWQPLCGRYTKEGSLYQNSLPAIYDGQQFAWTQEEIDLSDYLGQKIDLQFVMSADEAVNYAGFFLDDINVISILDTNTGVASATSQSPTVSVFPNPAHTTVSIQVSGYHFSKPLTAVLYDNLGRVVATEQISKPSTSINVSELPAGMYYLRTENDELTLPVVNLMVR